MARPPVDDFPLPAYVAAWKIFRSVSNEDEQTAHHIAEAINGQCRDECNLLDVGPGDGRVLLRILLSLKRAPSKLTFVEPDKGFFDETRRAIGFFDFAKTMNPKQSYLSDLSDSEIAGHDVAILSHSAYFLEWGDIERLISLLPKKPIYIVFDSEESIFSRLWAKTAPDYLDRINDHRSKLISLRPACGVKRVGITARVRNPLDLREDIRDMLLSLLCYSDVRDMSYELYEWVRNEIEGAVTNGKLTCHSDCFVVISK